MDQSLQNSLITALYIVTSLVTIGVSFWQIMKIPKKIWRVIIIFFILVLFGTLTVTLQRSNVIFKIKPNKPELLSPINKYVSLGEAPELMWKGDDNSVAYYVNISSSNKKNIDSGWIASNSWKPSLPNEDSDYSWRVKAFGKSGLKSEWSEERNFSIKFKLSFIGGITFIPYSYDEIGILASTNGVVGVTMRASVNTANDGSSNGEWIVIKEIGVPKFNENDAPIWDAMGWPNGTYRIRVEAKGPNDPNWQHPVVIETTYILSITTPSIEDLSFNPGSGAQVGATVKIHAKATWNSAFRSMRLKIDGNIVYELGSPEFNYDWNTSGYSTGSHTIRLEVAAQGDNSWNSPSSREASYNLVAKNVGLNKPTLSSPSNGALFPPGTDITLQWNPVSGATEYLVEIWGGQYGGNHNTLGGWQGGTSRHIGTMSPSNVLWRVKARNSSGVESPWSDEWNFTPQ